MPERMLGAVIDESERRGGRQVVSIDGLAVLYLVDLDMAWASGEKMPQTERKLRMKFGWNDHCNRIIAIARKRFDKRMR